MITLEVEVALLPSLIAPSASPESGWAIVIDTLRFTTTAIQGLVAGGTSVSVASDIEAVHQLAASRAVRPLLCGERHCRPIAGFDLGNSPAEYTTASVGDKQLLFTTTNGTLAVAACRGFGTCVLASLLNRSAVARALLHAAVPRCSIVCAGTDGQIALEDVLAAGAILDALLHSAPDRARLQLQNDSAQLALAAWQQAVAPTGPDPLRLASYFRTAAGGQNLVEQGYASDLTFAAQVDSSSVIPRLDRQLTEQFGCQTFIH
jgi:2-phosphosulfolactate phosphatase